MWYRRLFQLPSEWDGLKNATNFLLHFDGVDWEAEVFVNGQRLGAPHRGGYADTKKIKANVHRLNRQTS